MEGPLTPVSTSQKRAAGGHIDANLRTPSRSRQNKELPGSPQRQHRKKIVNIPESPPKKPLKLGAFVNAFEQTTPKPSQAKVGVRFAASQPSPGTSKGKGKERADPAYDEAQQEDVFFNPPSQSSPPKIPKPDLTREDPHEDTVMGPPPVPFFLVGPSANSAAAEASQGEDVEMKDLLKPPPPPVEPILPLWEPDWMQEVCATTSALARQNGADRVM